MRHQPLRFLGTLVLMAMLLFGTVTTTSAQDNSPVSVNNPPVDLHMGTCANPTPEPKNEIGDLRQQDYGEVSDDIDEDLGNQEPLPGDANGDGLVTDDAGYMTEDVDGDGVLDDGEDLNGNGVLDEGVDMDGDGMLGDDEIAVVAVNVNYPTIWKAEGEVDADFDELFEEQHVIAVHQSPGNYGTLIACGNISDADWDDEDQIVIGLHPVDSSGYYGYAVLERDTGNIPIFGENTTGVTAYLFENLPTQAETRMQGTPTSGGTTQGNQDSDVTANLDSNGDGDITDEEGYLAEDADGDGVLDEGEDTNNNGELDEGVDMDNDGLLDDDEIL